MNVLKPVEFHGYIEQGGSTKPWKVSLLQNDGVTAPYVLKVFTRNNIIQYQAVAKEVYGNILAKELGLPVPDMALVHLNVDFINFALSPIEQKELEKKDTGLKFACRLANNMSTFSSVLNKKYLKDHDISNIFAFDALIFNTDRGGFRDKPNLLVDDESFLLIDHELIFHFANTTKSQSYNKILNDFNNGKLGYQFAKHLFYPFLKDSKPNIKKHLFDEFGEYLSKMQTDTLENAIHDLNRLGVPTGQSNLILDYLHLIKKNHNKFCDILLASIL